MPTSLKRLTSLFLANLLLTIAGVSCAQDSNAPPSPATVEAIGGVKLPAISTKFRNPWTAELEAGFQERAASIIRHFANPDGYGNGYGENEKQSYPRAMFDFLAGNRQKALAFLQAEDPQVPNHAHTEGIDYYYSFTLKGQIRKYFLFGQFLNPAYKQRMFRGAKQWTAKDPLTQPHPRYGMGDGSGRDWDISKRGRWVDARNTDNLRAMRETSIYLMAEETGNEETRQIYKRKLQRYVSALYHIGMGEWDSEVYHSHTFAPYLNLYDFAKDREVKALAKAALDWLAAAAAVKYYRGGWGGAVKRDYGGGNVGMGSSAARSFWLYFGDSPLPNDAPELDTLHFITSRYRPPQAVVALAQKKFAKPVEILSSKPVYENWKPGNDVMPGYWETLFFGKTYQMGSVAAAFPAEDVAPFKLMAYSRSRGVDFFVANTGNNWVRQGKNLGDEIGQYRNLLIWLRPVSEQPFFFQLPKTAMPKARSATAEVESNIWFFKLEKTWLALRPINLTNYTPVPIQDGKYGPIYQQEQTYKAMAKGKNYAGFALEVGEEGASLSYEQFKASIKQKSQLDLSALATGKVTLKGADGNTLQLTYNPDYLLPVIERDGKRYDWSNHFALYDSQSRDGAPISLGWKQGKLRVKAGGLSFETEVKSGSND
jgi:hypothetical protein